MAKKEKYPKEGKFQKPLYKGVIAVSLACIVGAGLFGCGKPAEPSASPAQDIPPVAPSETASNLVVEPDVSPENDVGAIGGSSAAENDFDADVNFEAIENAIAKALPQEYQSSEWFFVSCDQEIDGSIFVLFQIDQSIDDPDAALTLSSECFSLTRDAVESVGATLSSCNITVVNKGAPIGIYSTEDGENYIIISDGKRQEVSLP